MTKLQTNRLAFHNEATDEFWIIDDDQFRIADYDEIIDLFTETYSGNIPNTVLPDVLLKHLRELPEDETEEANPSPLCIQCSILSIIDNILYNTLQRDKEVKQEQIDVMLKLQQLKLMILKENN